MSPRTPFDLSPPQALSRRRFLSIAAAVAGMPIAPGLARAAWPASPEALTWRGIALGASASLTLSHPDAAAARSAIAASLAEVARLEAIFSLHRRDSAIARLNADGILDDAPADLRQLLSLALRIAEQTDGAFDPTIQPLWTLYARHFQTPGASVDGPSEYDISAALRLVDRHGVSIDANRIRLAQRGMALTLNGIAQGYISDKVGDLLRERGFASVLVDMGEQLAVGPRPDGSAWRVGIADPVSPDRITIRLPLAEGAVATSSGHGTTFDSAHRFTHILDPRTGRPAKGWSSISVLSKSAAVADGLSTALVGIPAARARDLLGPDCRAYAIATPGQTGVWL